MGNLKTLLKYTKEENTRLMCEIMPNPPPLRGCVELRGESKQPQSPRERRRPIGAGRSSARPRPPRARRRVTSPSDDPRNRQREGTVPETTVDEVP